MKKLFRNRPFSFILNHKLFSLIVAACLLAAILQITSQTTATHWVLGVAVIIACFPFIRDMWSDFSSGSYGVEILAITAIITSLVLKQYWVAIIIVLTLLLGEVLEAYASRQVRKELDTLISRVPKVARVVRGTKVSEVASSQVRPNDRLVISPGETVPVDAVILGGSGSFDESPLTGENIPVVKELGDTILSGSTNIDGEITARAIESASGSQYQHLVRLSKAAASSQAPFVRLSDRYSVPFTAFALALGIAVWALSHHAIRFLEVIVVATPTSLILGASIAILSGIGRASKYGITIRTGSVLEQLAMVRTVAFNKTGTLTQAAPAVAAIISYGKHTKDEILGFAGALEASSSHLLGKAISRTAVSQKVKIPKARHITRSPGHGISAVIGGKKILAGRISLMHKHGIELPKTYAASAIKQTVTYVAIDGQLAGAVTFTDAVRPEAETTLSKLRRLGVRHFMIITGDNESAANATAKKLGITDVIADALPAAKLHAIEAVHHRPVAFVGDGISDAPVLTTADIGIALAARGFTAASDSADVIVMTSDISLVAQAVGIAKHAMILAKRSIIIGISLSLLLMAIFATGKFSPLYGVILQEIIDIIVVLYALNARTGNPHP